LFMFVIDMCDLTVSMLCMRSSLADASASIPFGEA